MKYYFLIVCLLLNLATAAQEHEVNYTGQLWSEIDLSGKISKKLKWQVDLQYSRQGQYDDYDLFRFNSQFTFRPWLHYYPVKNLRISAFAGLWYNFAISEAGAREYPEYRGALQATWYRPKAGRLLSYRFRSEFRDIEDRQGAFEHVVRLRYMVKYLHTLYHASFDKHAVYAVGFNEFFMNGGSKVTGYHLFDQNRVFLGVGYNITDDVTFETGYFNQLQEHAHEEKYDMNHIWQLTLMIDNIHF